MNIIHIYTCYIHPKAAFLQFENIGASSNEQFWFARRLIGSLGKPHCLEVNIWPYLTLLMNIKLEIPMHTYPTCVTLQHRHGIPSISSSFPWKITDVSYSLSEKRDRNFQVGCPVWHVQDLLGRQSYGLTYPREIHQWIVVLGCGIG